MNWHPMAPYTGREDDDPRGRDQQPESDGWPGWTGVRVSAHDHLAHHGHPDREGRP